MGRRSWSKEQTHSPVSVSSIWPAETGVVARLAAPLLGSKGAVTAIDLNPTMLSVGRAAAEGEGLDIEWRRGRAEQLPFADCSFDLVLC